MALSAKIIEITDQNFEQTVLKSTTPVLVDFWATWCGPCKAIAPTVDQMAVDYAGKLKVVKVDVDANMEVSNRYGILSIPALLLFKNGQVVEKLVGALPKPVVVSKVQPHL